MEEDLNDSFVSKNTWIIPNSQTQSERSTPKGKALQPQFSENVLYRNSSNGNIIKVIRRREYSPINVEGIKRKQLAPLQRLKFPKLKQNSESEQIQSVSKYNFATKSSRIRKQNIRSRSQQRPAVLQEVKQKSISTEPVTVINNKFVERIIYQNSDDMIKAERIKRRINNSIMLQTASLSLLTNRQSQQILPIIERDNTLNPVFKQCDQIQNEISQTDKKLNRLKRQLSTKRKQIYDLIVPNSKRI